MSSRYKIAEKAISLELTFLLQLKLYLYYKPTTSLRVICEVRENCIEKLYK